MVRSTKRSEVVLEVVVLSLIFGVSLVFVGDIVHQDNIAPKRPGCDNNFVLVKVPTWIGNNEEEEFVGVGARFGPSLESKEKDTTKSRVTLADPPDFISNQGSLVPNTALGWFSSSDYSEASTFIITYPVNNVIDKESNETKGQSLGRKPSFSAG